MKFPNLKFTFWQFNITILNLVIATADFIEYNYDHKLFHLFGIANFICFNILMYHAFKE